MSLKECQTALDNFRKSITEMERSVQTIIETRDALAQSIAALQLLKEARDLKYLPHPNSSDLTIRQKVEFIIALQKEAARVTAFTKRLNQMVGPNNSLH